MKGILVTLLPALLAAGGCTENPGGAAEPGAAPAWHAAAEAGERGPHGGRLLEGDGFRIELAIFETGVEPQFRAWASAGDQPLPPSEVELNVELIRLGGDVENFEFTPVDDYLLGGGAVAEPHSFEVAVTARYGRKTSRWQYESFEGRTGIDGAVARESGIVIETAGPATLHETLLLHGTVVPDPQRVFRLHARFPGVVRDVRKRVGDSVRAGETVAVIEANESLQRYELTAPAAGVVVSREVNPGVAVGDEPLLTIVDVSTVWVELAAFQHDMGRVAPGQPVTIRDVDGHQSAPGRIDSIAPVGSAASQSMTARAVLPNPDGRWRPGLFVTGEVTVAEHEVPLAVRRSALQTFRDWTVVFERVGDLYEVRPLRLGRSDSEWAEVLEGLTPGASYVVGGSYLIKADIEKSGASHDH